MNRLFGYINTLNNGEQQLIFKAKILALAKVRSKELKM
jgi:hypothetical protein